MKNLSLLLTALLFSFTCFGQEISKVLDFKLPQGAQKLSDKQVESFSTIGNVKTALPSNGMQYYSVGSISIGFLDFHRNKDFQEPLERIVNRLKHNYSGTHTNVNAEIKTFNNIRFLIYSYDDSGLSYIRFYTEYHNDYSVSGLAQFNKVDSVKATKVLYDMLNTAKFKD